MRCMDRRRLAGQHRAAGGRRRSISSGDVGTGMTSMISTASPGKIVEVRVAFEQLGRRFVQLRLHDDIAGEVVLDVGDAVRPVRLVLPSGPPFSTMAALCFSPHAIQASMPS